MSAFFKNISIAWRGAFQHRSTRNQIIVSVVALIAVYFHHFHSLQVWQSRTGLQLNDALLNQFPPGDYSLPIFFFEYSSLIIVIVYLLPYPSRLIKGIQAFVLITVARTLCIGFFALEPPRDMVLLNDPFANLFLHSKTVFVTKDLFFSGHIATLALLAFLPTNKYIKAWCVMAMLVVGILLLCQHVHYSLDIIFAPVISFLLYRVVLFAHRQSRSALELQGQEG